MLRRPKLCRRLGSELVWLGGRPTDGFGFGEAPLRCWRCVQAAYAEGRERGSIFLCSKRRACLRWCSISVPNNNALFHLRRFSHAFETIHACSLFFPCIQASAHTQTHRHTETRACAYNARLSIGVAPLLAFAPMLSGKLCKTIVEDIVVTQ